MSLQKLAAELDLDVYEVGICHACLSFVSFPLDDGDERRVARALRKFGPILWEEGLAEPLQAALERGAERAIADVEASGAQAAIVTAVIRQLAADLTRRTREDLKFLDGMKPL
jgi:hypothetical protein